MAKSHDPVKIAKVLNISIKDAYAIIGIELSLKQLPKSRTVSIDINLDNKIIKLLRHLAKSAKVSINTILTYVILKSLSLYDNSSN